MINRKMPGSDLPAAIHEIRYECQGMQITGHNTQGEIAELLLQPGVKLISINDRGCSSYKPRKKTAKRK